MKYVSQETGSDNGFSLAAQEHTDIGLLTLMFCSPTPGLQVLSPSFEWESVENNASSFSRVHSFDSPTPPVVFVIAGEQLSQISAGRYAACYHQVVPACEMKW